MKIIPETLKHWRKKRGFSQQRLAEEADIDQKTVARIEVGKGGETRGGTVKQIAKALRVKPEVLAEEPDSEAEHDEEVRKKYGWGVLNHRLRLDGGTLISYDLIHDRYSVGMYDLIKVAPLLFTILAEMSLAERRRRLEESEEAIDAFNRVRPEHISGRGWEGYYEKDSIAKRDLFARSIDWMEVDESYYEENRNPFNDFLIEQAKNLGPDNEAIDHEEIHHHGNFDDLPSFSIFETYRRKNLTGGSARADYALTRGYGRINQIPKELRGEDTEIASKRVKWLEAKVPKEDWAEYEAEWIRIEQLLNEVSSKGAKEDV